MNLPTDIIGLIVSYLDRCFDRDTRDVLVEDLSSVKKKEIDVMWFRESHIMMHCGIAPKDSGRISDRKGVWWTMNGKLHKENGEPAIIYDNGSAEWWENGELHREGDMPAIDRKNGTCEWFIQGVFHRDGDQPASILNDGTIQYFQHGKLHRDVKNSEGESLPAYIDGHSKRKMWYVNGQLHRDDGPAILHRSGRGRWYKNGIEEPRGVTKRKMRYTSEEESMEEIGDSDEDTSGCDCDDAIIGAGLCSCNTLTGEDRYRTRVEERERKEAFDEWKKDHERSDSERSDHE